MPLPVFTLTRSADGFSNLGRLAIQISAFLIGEGKTWRPGLFKEKTSGSLSGRKNPAKMGKRRYGNQFAHKLSW